MITENELAATKLSPTHKDYYQIWNELLDLAKKLSERWDPTSTNESDPGIVLLKVATALTDKLNYNIDKNILEAFMPSAAQEESMRKLCDMMGYSMKYYRSATAVVSITHTGEEPLPPTLTLPKFTAFSDADNTITYVSLRAESGDDSVGPTSVVLSDGMAQNVLCMEGQAVHCEDDNDYMVAMAQLTSDYRYYLPETQIAENGIFVYSFIRLADGQGLDGDYWQKVDNLNTQERGSKVWKFSYDSSEGRPYIQFPDWVSQIIDNGLSIYFIRTSGANGNISARTLSTFTAPTEWAETTASTSSSQVEANVSADDFTVLNQSAATNGQNPETITQAYENYKKTIGTFDTLVTCRDYMNYIYNLYVDADSTPLVSNAIVADIRDDINNSTTLCSFNDFGICYVNRPAKRADGLGIDNFTLKIYPFKTVMGANTPEEYRKSFTYDPTVFNQIVEALDQPKTIAHQLSLPSTNTANNGLADIACVKNFLKLNAVVTTTSRVNAVDEAAILLNIQKAIYSAFNLRKLDFGEEIPFDSILQCIANADVRIKNVSLDEPILYTRFYLANSDGIAGVNENSEPADYGYGIALGDSIGRHAYDKLTLRNLIAGRVELFKYDESLSYELTETTYPDENVKPIYQSTPEKIIARIESNCTLPIVPLTGTGSQGAGTGGQEGTQGAAEINVVQGDSSSADAIQPITLLANEMIRFRAPNFRTTLTYPAYVNYYFKTSSGRVQEAVAANMMTLQEFMANGYTDRTCKDSAWQAFIDLNIRNPENENGHFPTQEALESAIADFGGGLIDATVANRNSYGALFKIKETETATGTAEKPVMEYSLEIIPDKELTGEKQGYYFPLNSSSVLPAINSFVKSTKIYNKNYPDEETPVQTYVGEKKLPDGLYIRSSISLTAQIGRLVDKNYCVYKLAQSPVSTQQSALLSSYYVPNSFEASDATNGLGSDAKAAYIPANSEYELKSNETLFINYTEAEADQTVDLGQTGSTEQPAKVVNVAYGPGTIIRPNFNLYSSSVWREQGHSYSKTAGFQFAADPNLPGMYSMAADEQIDIRSKATLTIGNRNDDVTESTAFLYWIYRSDLSTSGDTQGDKTSFIIPSSQKDGSSTGASTTYVLGDGEYIFYTNAAKTSMAYYGSGTKITKVGEFNTPSYSKTASTISAEEIFDKGISAVPWVRCSFGPNKYLLIEEGQYVNLTEGDTLNGITLSPEDSTLSEITTSDAGEEEGEEEEVEKITNAERGCVAADYETKDGETMRLPIINVGNEAPWTVRSYLTFNFGPSTTQTLQSERDSLTIKYKDSEGNELEEDDVIKPSTSSGETIPLSVKSTVSCVGLTDKIFLTSLTDKEQQAFKLRTFSDMESISVAESAGADGSTQKAAITLHNFGDHWTRITHDDLVRNQSQDSTGERFAELYVNLPNDKSKFGMLTIYVNKPSEGAGQAYFKAYPAGLDLSPILSSNKNKVSPKIYNYPASDADNPYNNGGSAVESPWSWWDGEYAPKADGKYPLKPGVNNIFLGADGATAPVSKIRLYLPEQASSAVVSDIRIVDCGDTFGLDLDYIDYKAYSSSLAGSSGVSDQENPVSNAKQLLLDLAAEDPERQFYYACFVDNRQAINVNKQLVGSENGPKMSSPATWYDPNNLNNKFVVSEIDQRYLNTGIQIATTSKLR